MDLLCINRKLSSLYGEAKNKCNEIERERERNSTKMAMRAAKSINVKIKRAEIDLGLFFYVDSKPLEFSDVDKHMVKGP